MKANLSPDVNHLVHSVQLDVTNVTVYFVDLNIQRQRPDHTVLSKTIGKPDFDLCISLFVSI